MRSKSGRDEGAKRWGQPISHVVFNLRARWRSLIAGSANVDCVLLRGVTQWSASQCAAILALDFVESETGGRMIRSTMARGESGDSTHQHGITTDVEHRRNDWATSSENVSTPSSSRHSLEFRSSFSYPGPRSFKVRNLDRKRRGTIFQDRSPTNVLREPDFSYIYRGKPNIDIAVE